MHKRNLTFGISLVVAITVLACAAELVDDMAANQDGATMAPMFEVDPFWPKPLPNHWILGATIGVDVDSRDDVWLVHRNTPDQFAGRTELGSAQDPPLSECCSPAPPVLHFDSDGNLVDSWGGPTDTGDYVWPVSNHGITVDHMDNVWIGGNGGPDRQILKFSRDGDFLNQFGESGAQNSSLSTENFGRVAKLFADRYAAEIRAVQPRGPYHLLGWSLGGVIAHAVAARLQDVAQLVLVDAHLSAPTDAAAAVLLMALLHGLARASFVDRRIKG